MKAIPLWQPWASLWLSGAKLHETRHWHIRRQWPDWKPGDRAAIHATKKFIKDHDSEFAQILRAKLGPNWFREMPTGALIGTIAVMDCVPSESIYPAGSSHTMTEAQYVDYLSGDFAPKRFAWRGADPVRFAVPIPWKGSQGIFNVPDDVLERIAA